MTYEFPFPKPPAVATSNDPDVRRMFVGQGLDVVGNRPDEFRTYIRSVIPKWAAVVTAAGVKVD
jgi:tripartite-type tricarboxylate transporter receptor subunit TctC